MASRYAIAEWFGRTPASLSPAERQRLAETALADEVAALPCPFKIKLAVCVDRPFFDAIGGPSQPAEQDLNAGDVIWMAPELVEDSQGSYVLRRGHWEVLTLEDSSEKLLAARTISRAEFETTLRAKLAALRG